MKGRLRISFHAERVLDRDPGYGGAGPRRTWRFILAREEKSQGPSDMRPGMSHAKTESVSERRRKLERELLYVDGEEIDMPYEDDLDFREISERGRGGDVGR